jgi:lipopolysaccharide transport protein LptA
VVVAVIVVALASGLLLPGCADRAHADPAPPPCIAAAGIEIAATADDGSRVRIAADSATLAPEFPDEIAGAFEGARATIAAPPAEPAKDAPPAEAAEFSVEARRMRYDSRADRASFSGGVVLTMGEMKLTCNAVEVTYRRSEGVADFTATGSVRLERPDLIATAGKAEYAGATRILALTESPRVEGDLGTLEGSRIVLSLGEESVTVEEVRGHFRIR